MNELDFTLDAKALDDDGHIEGLAAGYGNLDHSGDVILPGAISRSIAGRTSVPMLMYHDQKRPAGVWTDFQETSDGLLVKGRFSMSTTTGREAHGLVKDGAIGGLSIGYRAIRDRIVGKARYLIEVALHEVSLVTIPMNEKALITSVKSLIAAGQMPSLSQFEDFLREAGFSKSQATAIAGKGLAPLLHGPPRIAAAATARYGVRNAARTGIAFHWRVQPVIHVSHDGRSALLRTRLLQPRTSKWVKDSGQPNAVGFNTGMYPNDQVVWKTASVAYGAYGASLSTNTISRHGRGRTAGRG